MEKGPDFDAMDIVLECLLNREGKMTESTLVEATGLSWGQVGTALYRLSMRGMVRLDSFEHSKRGGQAGVRSWGVSSKTALWEAVREDDEGEEE